MRGGDSVSLQSYLPQHGDQEGAQDDQGQVLGAELEELLAVGQVVPVLVDEAVDGAQVAEVAGGGEAGIEGEIGLMGGEFFGGVDSYVVIAKSKSWRQKKGSRWVAFPLMVP